MQTKIGLDLRTIAAKVVYARGEALTKEECREIATECVGHAKRAKGVLQVGQVTAAAASFFVKPTPPVVAPGNHLRPEGVEFDLEVERTAQIVNDWLCRYPEATMWDK